jgi:hypothetical protein
MRSRPAARPWYDRAGVGRDPRPLLFLASGAAARDPD